MHHVILIGESPTNNIPYIEKNGKHSSFGGGNVSSHSNSVTNHVFNNEMYSSLEEEDEEDNDEKDGNGKDNNEEDFESYNEVL